MSLFRRHHKKINLNYFPCQNVEQYYSKNITTETSAPLEFPSTNL